MKLIDRVISAIAVLGELAVSIVSCALHGEAPTAKNLYADTALRVFRLRWSPGRLLGW